jgi:hypothetical protein
LAETISHVIRNCRVQDSGFRTDSGQALEEKALLAVQKSILQTEKPEALGSRQRQLPTSLALLQEPME